MKKFLSFFAAMCIALAANATIWHVSPTSSDAEGDQATCNIFRTLKAEHAQPGDTVLLADGEYIETQSIYLNNSVLIMAAEGAHPVIKQVSYFKLLASAKFVGIKFLHDAESNGYCMYFQPGCTRLELQDCEITNFKETCMMSWETYELDSLIINNCNIHDNVKSAVYDPNGCIAHTVITNTTFANNDVSPWSAGLIDIRTASPVGNTLLVDHCTFYHNLLTNSDYGEVRPRGLAGVLVSNCIFAQPEPYERRATRFSDNGGDGEVKNCLTFNYTKNSDRYGHYTGSTLTNCAAGDPLFVDAANGDYTLGEGSPALTMNDGAPIGDPRWVPAPAAPAYYLSGSMNEWAAAADGYLFTANPAAEGEYMLDVTLAAGDMFKVRIGDTWYPDGDNNNYIVDAAHAGEAKKVYFRPDGQGGEGWHYGVIFVEENPAPQGELKAVSDSTTWDFSKLTINTSSANYNTGDNAIKLSGETTPKNTDTLIYAAYAGQEWTIDASFAGESMAFVGQYPARKNQFCQNGTLMFEAAVPGTIVVKFSDTGSSASATAVKRYLIVNGDSTEYWTSRENNGTDNPYPAQLNVVTGAIPVPAGLVTIAGSSAITVYQVTFVPTAVEHTYTIAGSSAAVFGTTWDAANTANDMVKQEDGTYKFEKTKVTLAAGKIEFKLVEDHTKWAPDPNMELDIPAPGVYTITITFDPNAASAAEQVTADATKTADAEVLPMIVLHGNFTGSWADTEEFVVAEDKLTASLTMTLTAGTYEFGMKFDGNWKANGAQLTREAPQTSLLEGNGNMKVTADVAGEYVFTYTFLGEQLVVTYPAQAEGIEDIDAALKAVKYIENGQVVIERNGKVYTVTGMLIR